MNQRGWSLIEVLAAIVVVGIGIALFTKVQGMTRRDSSTNSKILMAGKMIEKQIEDTRIKVSQNPVTNWPPKSTTVAAVAPDRIKLVCVVSPALSPKDNAVVVDVVKLDITATWTTPKLDTLKVTTYVSKRF